MATQPILVYGDWELANDKHIRITFPDTDTPYGPVFGIVGAANRLFERPKLDNTRLARGTRSRRPFRDPRQAFDAIASYVPGGGPHGQSILLDLGPAYCAVVLLAEVEAEEPEKPPKKRRGGRKRVGWMKLSADKRKRYSAKLKAMGIKNPRRYYEQGGDLTAARGMSQTPERPTQALRQPLRFASYILRHREELEDRYPEETGQALQKIHANLRGPVRLYVQSD